MTASERNQPDPATPTRVGIDPLAALDSAYLEVILEAERRLENAPGADKSWVIRMDAAYRRHYEQPRQS